MAISAVLKRVYNHHLGQDSLWSDPRHDLIKLPDVVSEVSRQVVDDLLHVTMQCTIGRDPEVNVCIDAPGISRWHLVVKRCVFGKPERQVTAWFVKDLNSKNGVFVNNVAVSKTQYVRLQNSDMLSFGPPDRTDFVYQFLVNYLPPSAAVGAPLSHSTPLTKTMEAPGKKRKESADLDDSVVVIWPVDEKKPESDKKKQKNGELVMDVVDAEFGCSVCHELVVQAVNLNCSHMFCWTCIEQWKETKPEKCCPMCRNPIVAETRVTAVDNLIERMVEMQDHEVSVERKKLVEQRKNMMRDMMKRKAIRNQPQQPTHQQANQRQPFYVFPNQRLVDVRHRVEVNEGTLNRNGFVRNLVQTRTDTNRRVLAFATVGAGDRQSIVNQFMPIVNPINFVYQSSNNNH